MFVFILEMGFWAESSRVDPVVRYYLKHLQIQQILSENGFPIMGPIFPIRDNEVN